MGDRYRRWCFTLNNPVDGVDYFNKIKDAEHIRRFVYGVEVGESGTKHLQGYIEFTAVRRIAPLKIMFPTAHWESAKGNYKQNYVYCTKENNSCEYGDWSGAANTITKNKNKRELVTRLLDGDKRAMLLNEYVAHKRSIDAIVTCFRNEKEKRRRYDVNIGTDLRGWQIDIFKKLMLQNDREITWVYDITGGKGKSWFAAYLRDIYGYDLLDGLTKTRDVVQLLSEEIRGICFDVTRSDATHFCYSTLEHAKNGYMITGKYEGIKRLFKICPVIVFANFEPIRSALSDDRWDIHRLDDGIHKATISTKCWSPTKDYPPPPKTEDPLKEDEKID